MRSPALALAASIVSPAAARPASIEVGEVLRLRAMVERLAADLAAARYELRQIRARHADDAAALMARWGLTRGEALFLSVLVDRGEISREGMDLALYGSDARGNKVLDVWLCKCRRKVVGLDVETVLGWGWRITEASRALVRAEIGEAA